MVWLMVKAGGISNDEALHILGLSLLPIFSFALHTVLVSSLFVNEHIPVDL